jgi:iron complex outermembrane receptor protein
MLFKLGSHARKVKQVGPLVALSAILLLGVAAPAFAQSTATQEIETVTVTAEVKVPGEVLTKETIPKARGTITSEYIKTQPAGQTIFQSLNSVPGFNFTNSDPYGSSGGDVRIRGFDGPRIAFTWDGMPLNDTGNYAIFTNQVADPEIVDHAQVNQGTTDVDSPTASAVGGTVDLVTKTPTDDFNILLQPSAGSFAYERLLALINTGEFGPWGTKAFFEASYQHYDKFKGPGTLNKLQFNGRVYQDLGDLGFISVAAHFNTNRNAFYRNLSYGPTPPGPPFSSSSNRSPQVFHDPTTDSLSGLDIDEDGGCVYGAVGSQTTVNGGTDVRPTPTFGTQQIEGTSASSSTSLCTNYFGVRINPSDTGNVRGQSLFHITKDLSFTFDPSFQYVLANGGGITVFAETDPRLIGNSGATGVDLNGDGDNNVAGSGQPGDHVSLYTPNNTNTRRYGLTSSLIWQADDDNVLQVGYTLDFGIHRQTAIRGFLDANGNPLNKFGGLHKNFAAVRDADGSFLRGRDRKSYAILNQVAASYEGRWLDDMLRVDVGARLPFFQRDLNQFCYTQAQGSSSILTPGIGNPYCTTEPATPTGTFANGLPLVTFAGVSAVNKFVVPFNGVTRYSKFLPNAGVSLSPWGDTHQFYVSFAEGLSAPRTDNLYAVGIDRTVRPETTDAYDVGYRFLSDDRHISATIDGYNIKFKNRITSTFDPVSGTFIDTNVGAVNQLGVDASATVVPLENLSLFGSVSYEHSRIERNLAVTNPATTCNNLPAGTGAAGPCTILTAGKELVETPDWQFFTRGQYIWQGLELGLQGKFVGRRFGTDTNEAASRVRDYFVADADMSYDLGMIGFEGSSLRFNVTNVLNERYLGSIPTTQTCQNPTDARALGPQTFSGSNPCGTPLAAVGAPRAFQFTLDALLP